MAKIKKRGRKTPPQARRRPLAPKKAVAPAKARDADLKRQLAVARAQQKATAAILKVIARSPSDAQPVFEAIVENAHRLVGAVFSILYRFDGKVLSVLADSQSNPKASALLRGMYPAPARRDHIIGRSVLSGREMHTSDIRVDARFPTNRTAHAKVAGYRAALVVPLLRNGKVIGAVAAGRLDPRPFSRNEIHLLRSFADQAVIAIENVRLFNETRESLERQTATAEILKVIARSPSDVQPVLDAVAASSARLCDAADSVIHQKEGESLRYAAHYGNISINMKIGESRPVNRQSLAGRAVLEGRRFHVRDVQAEAREFPEGAELGRRGGYRTALVVPLLRNQVAIGTISIRRTEVRPFTEAQIELLNTFADQAVIAIENVRLFNETKEGLEQQTAISEVLRVISGSPTDVKPVLDAVAARAARICQATDALIFLVEGQALRRSASFGDIPAAAPLGTAIEINRGSLAGRAIVDRSVVHVPDIEVESRTEFPASRAFADRTGFRTGLAVPLMREDHALGVIALRRLEVRPFTDKQIALLKTFADQAAIAIENVRLFNETKEALERQTATAEILKVIASSPTDTQPVFKSIARSAVRLAGGISGWVFMRNGGLVELAAQAQPSAEGAEMFTKAFPAPIDDEVPAMRAIRDGSILNVADIFESDYAQGAKDRARAGNYRSVLCVPMQRGGSTIGSIVVTRREAGRFADHHIALLKTFADQAVIAIENVRLFNETKEALERQTATAEILKVISSSPSDLGPVFDAILGKATALCEAHLGILNLREGDMFRTVAQCGGKPELAQWLLNRGPFKPEYLLPGVLADRQPVHVADVRESPGYRDGRPVAVKMVELAGGRTFLVMPLLKEAEVIGAVSIYRPEVRPFTEKQIALLSTFASQAVIAIENVRLFKELEARNRDVTEALERQTATAEILKVIASSPSDVQPVFEAIAERAATLGIAKFAYVTIFDGDWIHLRATHGPGADEHRAHYPIRPGGDSVAARVIRDRKPVQIEDVLADPEYTHKDSAKATGFRSGFGVPMMRDGQILGAISLARPEPGAIPEKLLQLLQTFADQAVIAIENVRLFNETKEALERQTATAEILQVISGSLTDVQPVFDAIVESALRLFDGQGVGILLAEGDRIQIGSAGGIIDLEAARRRYPVPLNRDTVSGQAILDRTFVNIADSQAPEMPELLRILGRELGFRAIAVAPMMREGVATGAISVVRKAIGMLAQKEVALLKTFADQAVIAIENVRLFNETREALERQTATAEILQVISSSPTDTQPVFDAIVQNASRLFGGMDVSVNIVRENMLERPAIITSDEVTDAASDMFPMPISDDMLSGRTLLRGEVVHVPDLERESWISERSRITTGRMGYRSALCVPMMRESGAIGSIIIFGRAPGAFADKQIALLQTFAAQAVIAIDNVRLFNETREALEQQTATAEILKVISSSPTDTQPVFEAIVQSGLRLFSGASVGISLLEGDELCVMASGGKVGALAKGIRLTANRESAAGTSVMERRVVNIRDTEAPDVPVLARENGRKLGIRSMTNAPMFREGEAIGTIAVLRNEPGGLDGKQVALLQTFADQAVIAIENVRLFKELQSQTEALTKSVGQLTALGEVGQAISSTLDLETVLQTIVSHAVKLTGLDGGSIYEFDEGGGEFHLRAAENMPAELVELYRSMPLRLGEGVVGSAAQKREPLQVPDIQDPSYQTRYRDLLIRQGYRAILAVPLLREEQIIGALTVSRNEPGAFAPEIMELLKTFATQSAMAIQNARLFREIAEKGRQLEVASQHKSNFLASMSHELRTPLNAILGLNEMVLGEVYGEVPADMQPPLAQVQTSGKHLLRLINNVLDLAKIEAGRMELDLSDYSVQDTVSSVHSTLQPLATEKGLEFLANVSNDLELAYGDGGRIAQCLMNLAGNSLKFTKAGKVEISAAEKDGLLTYRVTDTGVGIPADKIASLFTEFKQTDATIASEYGGTGLGLSISKKFVEMHGGRIWVESELGKGSVFIIEVPLRVTTT